MKLALAAAILLVANLVIWSMVASSRPAGLQVSVLDIGQGDSILVEGPTGITMLVDGGRSGQTDLAQVGKELGLFDRYINLVVETHPDADHIGGLPAIFNRYQVGAFMEPGIPDDTSDAAALAAAASAELGVDHLIARRGMRIDLGGGAYADVLYPDRDPSKMDTNNGSITMHVVYGNTSFMLTGDLPSPVEDWLVQLDGTDGELPTDVLKAGHHGSKYSTDDAWLAALHPSMAAISAGVNNPYGHPAPETLDRIKNEGATIYSTLGKGTIHFVSDGANISEQQ
ncbi:MAG TPA: MBL fold metallo-hydrolase [Candidatus Paceibacterota bacterium]|nr:MBL fold metallo-hydrolase [Candidatus Paceibacterota bacterium]